MSSHESGKISDALGSIERELSAIWTPDPETPPKARVCTANVVVVTSPSHREKATQLIDALRTAEVARTFLLGVDPKLPPWGIETDVSARCQRDGEQLLCSERIELTLGSATMTRAGSLVANLLMAEVPTAVVLLDPSPPALWSSLLEGAARVVVDSEVLGLEAAVSVAGATRALLFDLGWERLLPYRSLLAQAFDDEALRPALGAVTALRVAASPADGAPEADIAARLLVGWLASRLGWRTGPDGAISSAGGAPVALSISAGPEPGGVSAIELDASLGGLPLRLALRREGAALTLSRAHGGAAPVPFHGSLAVGSLAELVDRGINHPVADRPLREALAEASRLPSPAAPHAKGTPS